MSVCFELPQESENALAIKIREEIFKKLSECKSEDELKKVLVGILSENEQDLDLEKIQAGNETLNRLENFLACSVTETPDNLTETQIQLSQLLSNAAELICNPPELSIPYPFPIEDVSDDFLNKLLIALLRLVIKILFSILKKLLSLLIDICNSGLAALNGYGASNIADIINQSIGEEVGNSFIEEIFDAFGINSDGTAATITEVGDECDEDTRRRENNTASQTQALKDVKNLLDDLSFMLTPVEVCGLLNGKANDTTFQVVEELLTFEYPVIKNRLNTRGKIESLFKTLGTRNDPAICDLIENNAQTIISRPELCFTTDAEAIRRRILEDKNIPEDEIKNQLQKERDRNKANLEKVSELAAAVRTNPNKIFGDTPNIFCKNGSPGLFGLDDLPSLKESVSETIDASFDPFFDTYVKSANSFADFVITSDEVPVTGSVSKVITKFTRVTVTTEEGVEDNIEDAINPKFMQKVMSGQYILCDNNAKTDYKSVTKYYDGATVNGVEVFIDSGATSGSIDANTLVNAPNKKSLEGVNNVYILNTNTNSDVMPEIIQDVYPNIDSFFDMDITNMSISLKVPIKYTPVNKKDNKTDFTSVQSDDLLILFTTSLR
jgi:hypothetical protein